MLRWEILCMPTFSGPEALGTTWSPLYGLQWAFNSPHMPKSLLLLYMLLARKNFCLFSSHINISSISNQVLWFCVRGSRLHQCEPHYEAAFMKTTTAAYFLSADIFHASLIDYRTQLQAPMFWEWLWSCKIIFWDKISWLIPCMRYSSTHI